MSKIPNRAHRTPCAAPACRRAPRPATCTRLTAALVIGFALLGLAALPAGAGAVRGVDVSREVGVAEKALSRGALVLDYDGDKFDDLLVNRHYEDFFRLYRNEDGRRFTDVADQAFPDKERRRDRHGCDAADINRDGRQDFYCTLGGLKGGTGPQSKELWVAKDDGTYSELARRFGVANQYGRGRLAQFIDANGDRWPDLVVGNTYPRKDGRRSPNRLFINRKGRQFKRAPSYGLDKQVGADALQAVDFDADGREDLALCGPKGIRLYRNAPGRGFKDVTKRLDAKLACEHIKLAKLNRDRRLDLIVVTRDGVQVRLAGARGFRKPSFRLNRQGGEMVEVGRVNGDQLDDIYLVRSGRRDRDRPDVMLVNRRGGRSFAKAKIPQTRKGVGEWATAIDYDRNGRTDFLVQNGKRNAEGPVRLIAFGGR